MVRDERSGLGFQARFRPSRGSWVCRIATLVSVGVLTGCGATAPKPALAAPPVSGSPAREAPTPTTSTAPAPARRVPAPAPPPRVFESDEYVVTFAGAGETAEHLAAEFLGDPHRAWEIEDYNHTDTFTPGQEVVIPKHPWNPAGVELSGYQVVPVLTYYSLAPKAKGRLVMALATFESQMRYLQEHGYRVVSLPDLLAAGTLSRQLPRRAVVLTFSDGWESFREYAAPVLKGLGFPATVFVYTDFIGAGSGLSWAELQALAAEGFDIEVESKTHGDLRKRSGESDEDYARRLDEELALPLKLIDQHVGTPARALAYPYGAHNEELERAVKARGYAAAFDVRRQANPTFAAPFDLHRAQIYADMTLEDFAKSLEVFDDTSRP